MLINRGLYFNKADDSGSKQPEPEKKDDKPGDAPEAEKKNEGKSGQVVFENEDALQKEFEKRLKERLAREEKKRDEATRKAKEEAEAKALEEQKEFQKLAEKQKGQIADLEKKIGEFEPLNEKVKRFEAALTKFRDAQLGEVPEHLKPLLEKLDVVDQIEWLAANKEKLKTTPSNVPPTPTPANLKEFDEAEKKKASDEIARSYQNRF